MFNYKILIILGMLFFLTVVSITSVKADQFCGAGAICTGSNAYLRVWSCTLSSNESYCINGSTQDSYPHSCPVSGSCTAYAIGKNGCGSSYYVEESNCRCSTTYEVCTGNGTSCGGIYDEIGTCTCNIQPKCGAPTGGQLGCCATCNSSCVGKCGGTNDCGDPCPTCTNPVCGNGVEEPGENCQNCPQDAGSCCGNDQVDPGETCSNCTIDVGPCPPSPPPPTPSPGSTPSPEVSTPPGVSPTPSPSSPTFCVPSSPACEPAKGENCSNCESQCGACCGNDSCDTEYGEDYISCPIDCDSCGDDECNGFENCLTCSDDCGVCSTSEAWWQVKGGNSYAAATTGYSLQSKIPNSTCTAPDCIPSLSIRHPQTAGRSDGIPMTGGGGIFSNGSNMERNPNMGATQVLQSRYKETYGYFYRITGMPENPVDDFAATYTDAKKPTPGKATYFRNGNLVIRDSWDIKAGEKYVIFVDGDLRFRDPNELVNLVSVEQGGFIAFIVSGNIRFYDDFGSRPPLRDRSNVAGIYIADGKIIVDSAPGRRSFEGRGTFVAWGGFELNRDIKANGAINNTNNPAEVFRYRPDIVANTPDILKRPYLIWQETN